MSNPTNTPETTPTTAVETNGHVAPETFELPGSDDNTPVPGPVNGELDAAPETTPTTEDDPVKPAPKNPAGKRPAAGKPAKKTKPAAKKDDADGDKAEIAAEKAAEVRAVGIREPEGEDRMLDIRDLTFDPRVQMRVKHHDEETVERYKGYYEDDAGGKDRLPPIKVIEITDHDAKALNLPTRYVVWNGWQRTEAAKRANRKQIACTVAKGTFGQAVALSLQANKENGLPRNHADLRKAFDRLLNSPAMLAATMKNADKVGGGTRALAAAAGVSRGLVAKILDQMGKAVRGNQIVNKAKKPTAEPAPHKRQDEDPAGGMRIESKEAIKSRTTAAIIREMKFSLAQVQRRYESLLEREDAVTLFREIAGKHTVPLAYNESPVTTDEGTKMAKTEYWPAADALLATIEELEDQFSKMAVSK